MTFGSGETDPSQSRGGGSPARSAPPPQPKSPSTAASSTAFSISMAARSPPANGAITPSISCKDRAVFSVFRRASEVPLYRIEKNPKLARRQGAYSVISATGLIVRRGHELDRVLRVDRPCRSCAGGRADRLAAASSRPVPERALHQHAVEPAAELEADILADVPTWRKPAASCSPIEAACCAESPITAIICRKPRALAASISAASSARPTPRRCASGAT